MHIELPFTLRRRLDELAPLTIPLPSGRSAKLDYRDDGSIVASAKLQELFGLAESPRIGPHRTPVTFALLSPGGRPVQITQDLRGFWNGAYQQVRKELRGRVREASVARGSVDGAGDASREAAVSLGTRASRPLLLRGRISPSHGGQDARVPGRYALRSIGTIAVFDSRLKRKSSRIATAVNPAQRPHHNPTMPMLRWKPR